MYKRNETKIVWNVISLPKVFSCRFDFYFLNLVNKKLVRSNYSLNKTHFLSKFLQQIAYYTSPKIFYNTQFISFFNKKIQHPITGAIKFIKNTFQQINNNSIRLTIPIKRTPPNNSPYSIVHCTYIFSLSNIWRDDDRMKNYCLVHYRWWLLTHIRFLWTHLSTLIILISKMFKLWEPF